MADKPLQSEKDTIRYPLYSDDNQRQFQAGTYASIQNDSILFNCFATKDTATGEYIIQKRPGLDVQGVTGLDLSTVAVASANTCTPVALIGLRRIPNTFVCALSDDTGTLYIIAYGGIHGSGVILGLVGGWAVTSNKAHLTEMVIGGATTIGLITHDYNATISAGYYATAVAEQLLGGTLVQIVDVDFPGNVAGETAMGPFVQLNQHVFVMGRTGIVYNADQDSISSWNVRGVQPASIEPDKGLGLAKYKQHLVAFGDNSIEFFEDAGLSPPGGPLQRTEQAFIKFGTINSHTFRNINDTIYWLAAGESGTRGLYKLDQYTPTKVSPAWINSYIYPMQERLRLNSIFIGGQQHLLICGLTDHIVPIVTDAASFPTTEAAAGADFPVTANDLTSQMLCYAIPEAAQAYVPVQAGTWWAWSEESVPDVQFYVANSFAAVGTDNASQSILKSSSFNLTAGEEGSVSYALFDNLWNFHQFRDYSRILGYAGICVIIQHAPIEFVSEKRKSINRMTLNADAMVGDSTVGSNEANWLLYYVYNRQDGLGSMITRSMNLLSPNYRYYFNNLGMCRKLTGAWVCKNEIDFRARAMEITVAQSTG